MVPFHHKDHVSGGNGSLVEHRVAAGSSPAEDTSSPANP
jgi:hypothetical protein